MLVLNIGFCTVYRACFSLLVSQLGEHMRFGTTATMYGSMPDPRKDPRVHSSCFIAIRSEKLVKKMRQPHMIWICSESTHQLFEIVKVRKICDLCT